jgi:glutamine kinase
MSFAFGTKAETLHRLRGHLHDDALCDQIAFSVGEWLDGNAEIVRKICARFANQPLAIRSSARDEDTFLSSKAGAYRSVTRVLPEPQPVADAVGQVIASYRSGERDHQILVQPMVENVVISGVVLSRDLDTLSPYYAIVYDDFSGRTDTVTGGVVNKAMLVLRARPQGLHSPRIKKLFELVRRIEAATGCDELDIEFCITDKDDVVILQVRPLTVTTESKPGAPGGFEEILDGIHDELARRMRPAPGMLGRTTLFGEMPDWNPAEIIGSAPKPLALSIYKYLITDDVWRRSRARMGYRPVLETPLLIDFGGRPFIDVRASLNSFLPPNIGAELGTRLIDAQIARLDEYPELHDKIEFEIAVTCCDFAFAERARALREAGFSAADVETLRTGLAAVTRAALADHRAQHRKLEAMVAELDRRRSGYARDGGRASVKGLLADCRELGTLPFADLARHGFIGMSLLKSLVARGAFSAEDGERFLRSVHTVAGDMVRDMQALMSGAKPLAEFLAVYGHLRPGTYDILSWRYDEKPELYLGQGEVHHIEPVPFALGAPMRRDIAALLAEAGYGIEPEALLEYIEASIRLREWAKFAFSRSVSDALSALAEWGKENDLTREDLSHIEIGRIISGNGHADWKAGLPAARARYGFTRAIRLPHLISAPEDVYVVRLPLGQPNFITHKSVTAPVTILRAGETPPIDGTIVLTESADPGFDWIFSHGIAGLITKFGGANSHMAIRCAEFGLPAAIGCGERSFSILSKAKVVELNAGNRSVRTVR